MNAVKKIKITLAILSAAILLLLFLVVNPIFSQIVRESDNLVSQKKELLELEGKIANLRDSQEIFRKYQPNLDKIDKLFINASEPIEFIEFLEAEASLSRIVVAISPPVFRDKDGDFWPSLEFSLNASGSFPNFLRFLDRLESAPYLIRAVNLTVRQDPKIENNIAANLSVRIYSK